MTTVRFKTGGGKIAPTAATEPWRRAIHRQWFAPTTPDDRGSMAVELAILTVPLVVVLLFVAALGRLSEARNTVDEAARDAARSASMARNPDQAQRQATALALADLATSGIACRAPDVMIDTGDLRPGGRVTATVVCTVSFGDLLLLRVPGVRTITSIAVEVVDLHRSA